jgi:hypothetical protein
LGLRDVGLDGAFECGEGATQGWWGVRDEGQIQGLEAGT